MGGGLTQTPGDLVPLVYRRLCRQGCLSVFTTWHLTLSKASDPGEWESMEEAPGPTLTEGAIGP